MNQLMCRVTCILVLGFGTTSCLLRRTGDPSSEILASHSEAVISPTGVATFLETFWGGPDYAQTVDVVLQDPIARLFEALDHDIGPTTLGFPTGKLILSEPSIRALSAKNARIRTQVAERFPNVNSYLNARKINGQLIKDADLISAWLTLAALISGDESLANSLPSSGFGLVGPMDRARELIKLAKIGKAAHDSFGYALPIAMDSETWELIDRHRQVIKFAAGVSERIGKFNPEVAEYSRLMRQALRAVDIISNFPDDF